MEDKRERIRFQNVSMQFPTAGGTLDVVSDMTFAINQGEFIAVLGPNGSGKSTLLNTMLGIRRPTSGSVGLPERVGFIPQQRDILYKYVTRENAESLDARNSMPLKQLSVAFAD